MSESEHSTIKPTGVHLVGSVPLPTAEDVFTKTATALPNRLKRTPDGETSHRQNFVQFQRNIWASMPQVLRQYDETFTPIPTPLPTPEELSSVSEALESISPLQTHYDTHALESYKTFTSLRSSGTIPSHTKFQLCLPTPLNVLCMIADGYQATVEPFYIRALANAITTLSNSIPASDLSIQWDTAAEFAMLEGAHWPHFVPFFSPVKEGIVSRLIYLADLVPPEVECGFHLCYGDIGHKHFIEPKDMGFLVEIASAVMQRANRQVNYFHMPVPKNRTDKEYFAPLKDLELGKTELFLGVVHYDDLEGTKQRIESAASSGKAFGVATECGMGRTPAEQLDSILEISAGVSEAY